MINQILTDPFTWFGIIICVVFISICINEMIDVYRNRY